MFLHHAPGTASSRWHRADRRWVLPTAVETPHLRVASHVERTDDGCRRKGHAGRGRHAETADARVRAGAARLHPGVAAGHRAAWAHRRPSGVPEGRDLHVRADEEKQIVFSKPFRIEVPLTASRSLKPGPIELKGVLQYQACDDKVCYVPRKVEVRWVLNLQWRKCCFSLPPLSWVFFMVSAPITSWRLPRCLLARPGKRRRYGVRARWAWPSVSPSGTRCFWLSARGRSIVLGWSLPLVVERSGEMLGGMLLIVFGVVGLWSVAAGRVYGHTHVHGREQAPHFHLHVGRPDHHPAPSAHSHLPTIVGAAFAVSSLRALTMLAPFGSRVESGFALDAAHPDRGVRGRDPALDVALRSGVREAHVRGRRPAARARGRCS